MIYKAESTLIVGIIFWSLISVVHISGAQVVAHTSLYDIRDFGAIGDGKTLNTQAIQYAIDTCSRAGGGRVMVCGGMFLTGTIVLKDHVNLHVAGGAALLGSTSIGDYATDTGKMMYKQESRLDRCLIFAKDAKSISIEGSAVIDGQSY